MNILMIDELPLYIHGMKVELQRIMPESQVIDANNFDQACALLSNESVDLILLDGDMECAPLLPLLSREYPRIPVVLMLRKVTGKVFSFYLKQNIKGVLTRDQPVDKISQILKMVDAGIICFPEQIALSMDKKDSDDTVSQLSHRQQEVLELLAKGGTNKQIGRQLNISAGTVKVHLESIFNRLQVNNRTQAARLYFSYINNHVISE
ncbi:response regulator transcription factor [unidentified bacterial endosymbiont]|jgi:DNA-binding NarL/FixJ family response regulator|uniref:response regulator transcription factor n=1 Tax=unidentified bacterial endosymbiont TaxID=2355 RepID=UPI0020A11611|nr:response regulator transcription factor [unidentified bacterial endosymbiont]